MAKSTPKSSKVSTPKATPSASKASPSAAAPSSASKKRVRVVETDNAPEAAPASAKKPKSKDASAVAGKTGKNGVEMKDLKEKKLDEIEKIRSKDAPQPEKGALKGKGKKAEQAEDEEIKLGEGAESDGDDDDDAEAFLEGFESGEDGEDSSDEEQDDDEKNAKPFKVEELPKVKGDSVQKKLEAKAERKKNAKTGTVYLGRIPHGFHEAEMKSYFSQFGEVTRLRLSRNKTTGASKHYAFIEFQYASVAAIVQETMDNYLLSGHILVCKIIPDDQIHPKLWVGANRKFRVVPKGRKQNIKRDAPKTEEKKEAIKQRLLTREEKKRKQLAELGIEYDFAGYAGKTVEGETKEEVAKETPKKAGKKGRKSAEGPAKKKARKST